MPKIVLTALALTAWLFPLILSEVKSSSIVLITAKLIATPSFIPNLNVWQQVIWELDQTTRHAQSSQEVIRIVSCTSKMIKTRYFILRNEYHRLSLCALYSSIIDRFSGTQTDLVHLIETMRHQNEELNLALNNDVWTTFYQKFYALPNEYHDLYFHSLLNRMTLCAQPVMPDAPVFNAILYGLSTNPGIVNPEQAINNFIERVINSGDEIQEQIGLCHLAISASSLSVDRIIFLLMVHPNVALGNVTVYIINDVLNHLPEYYKGDKWKIDMIMHQMMNAVLNRYSISSNLETYEALLRLRKEFGISLIHIQQRHPGHDTVCIIVNRITCIKNTQCRAKEKHFEDIFGSEARQHPPNPMLKYPTAQWQTLMDQWTSSLGCNTQRDLVYKMVCHYYKLMTNAKSNI